MRQCRRAGTGDVREPVEKLPAVHPAMGKAVIEIDDALIHGTAPGMPERCARITHRRHFYSRLSAVQHRPGFRRHSGGRLLRFNVRRRGAQVSSTVTLPLWLVVFVGVLAILAALDHLLLPSARWFMRRRLNRAIDELNTRLKLRIQPFKLAKRQSLIDQLVFDPEVLGGNRDNMPRPTASPARPRKSWRATMRARSCRRFRPTPISGSVRGSLAGFRPCFTGYGSATWTKTRSSRSIPTAPSFSSSTTAPIWTMCWSPTWRRPVRRSVTPSANGRGCGCCKA